MDDYTVASLMESRNEWCVRLINIIAPLIMNGYMSIWKDALKTCIEQGEKSKYLMVFQNYLSQIPKWNSATIEAECKRIMEKSGCDYLEDLLSCVHIIQLKALTCIRVGKRQKKVELDVPSLETFIHNAYINCARKIYTNVFLFEMDIPALQIQKNNRELEMIIRECVIDTVRQSIPTEKILRAYLDESVEDDIETSDEIIKTEEEIPEEEVKEIMAKKVEEEVLKSKVTEDEVAINVGEKEMDDNSLSHSIEEVSDIKKQTLKFSDEDSYRTTDGLDGVSNVSKDIENLEAISLENSEKRKQEDDEEILNIGENIEGGLNEVLTLDTEPLDSMTLRL